MGYFQNRYNSTVIIYDRRAFIRLNTGHTVCLQREFKYNSPKRCCLRCDLIISNLGIISRLTSTGSDEASSEPGFVYSGVNCDNDYLFWGPIDMPWVYLQKILDNFYFKNTGGRWQVYLNPF